MTFTTTWCCCSVAVTQQQFSMSTVYPKHPRRPLSVGMAHLLLCLTYRHSSMRWRASEDQRVASLDDAIGPKWYL